MAFGVAMWGGFSFEKFIFRVPTNQGIQGNF